MKTQLQRVCNSYPSLHCHFIFPLYFPPLLFSASSFNFSSPHPAWMHLCARRPGWCPDGEHLLGALLSGTRHPVGRTDARPQACGRSRRLLHYLLQWDWGWEIRPQGNLCWPGTNCYWYDIMCCVFTYQECESETMIPDWFLQLLSLISQMRCAQEPTVNYFTRNSWSQARKMQPTTTPVETTPSAKR